MKNLIMALFLFCINLFAADYQIEKIHQLEINSSINPATHNYLKNIFQKVKTKDLVLIKLNTPGGLVSTTKDIMTLIGDVDFPVAVWITPEGASATSAGAIIASSAHLLFMSEGTNIGAATPIGMGEDIKESDGRAKAINDLVALVSSLAKARGRNEKAFALMIEKAASYDSQKAKTENIIDEIINSRNSLLNFIQDKKIKIKGNEFQLKHNNPEFIEHQMDLGLTLLNIFANPTTAYILFLIGAALLYFEFQAPGGFIMGGIGVLVLILAGIGFQVLPLNFGSLALIILAFILFVMEMYITSYGVLSLGGIAALVFGSLFLYRTDDSFLTMETSLVYSTVITILAFMGFITYILIKDSKQKKVEFFVPIDQEGTVLNFLKQEGDKYIYQVKVYGEIWNGISSTKLQKEDRIKVVSLDEGHLRVNITKL